MLIKDNESGTVRKYGSDHHDSLAISQDGRTLSYYNLQCGEGSLYGTYSFVMEDGEVPRNSRTPDAMHANCYFNIGGFDSYEQGVKDGKASAIDECKQVLKTQHMIRTCEDDFIAGIEAPFYKKLWKKFDELKEGDRYEYK